MGAEKGTLPLTTGAHSGLTAGSWSKGLVCTIGGAKQPPPLPASALLLSTGSPATAIPLDSQTARRAPMLGP